MSHCLVVIERSRPALLTLLAWLAGPGVVFAQDLEPRRWTHLPVGMSVGGMTYAYSDGDLSFDPVLNLEDVEVESHLVVGTYALAIDCFGKSGRLDLVLPYQTARWEGLQSGVPASTRRHGFADPWLRLSVNLSGAPALRGEEYLRYRGAHPTNTVVGAALAVMLPLGEYKDEKLLNLGQNRFIVRPQAGVVHTRGAWSYELTGSAFIFTDNDDFFGGNDRTQDPLYAFQAHAIHTFPRRWWTSVSAGYSWGGESEINGVPKDDERSKILSAFSFGLPVGKNKALKFTYLRGDSQTDVGGDTNNLLVSWTVRL